MNDEFEVDYNEESDFPLESEKKIALNGQSQSENISQNISSTQNNNYIHTPVSIKYFFIFYHNNNSDIVKDSLYDSSLKITKNNTNLFLNKEIEACKNVYFMFVNSDKKLIKAIMKKDYLKPSTGSIYIKLETKTKQEVSFRELIQEYKFSDENFGRLSIEEVGGDANFFMGKYLDLGSGLVLREIRDGEGINVFEKIRNAMVKKEKETISKRKRSRHSSSESSYKSSSSSGEKRRTKTKSKTKTKTNMAGQSLGTNTSQNIKSHSHPLMMNYYYPHQFFPPNRNESMHMQHMQHLHPHLQHMQYYPYTANANSSTSTNNVHNNNNNSNFQSYPQLLMHPMNMNMNMNFFANPGFFPMQQYVKKTKSSSKSKSNSPKSHKSHKSPKPSSKSWSSSSSNKKNRKKYFDLKHLSDYNELERTNSKNKESELKLKLALNDISVMDQDIVIGRERKKEEDYSSSSSSSSSGRAKDKYRDKKFIARKRSRSFTSSVKSSYSSRRSNSQYRSSSYSVSVDKDKVYYSNKNKDRRYSRHPPKSGRYSRESRDSRDFNSNDHYTHKSTYSNTHSSSRYHYKDKLPDYTLTTANSKKQYPDRNNKQSNFSDLPPREPLYKTKELCKESNKESTSKFTIPDEKFHFPENFVFSSSREEVDNCKGGVNVNNNPEAVNTEHVIDPEVVTNTCTQNNTGTTSNFTSYAKSNESCKKSFNLADLKGENSQTAQKTAHNIKINNISNFSVDHPNPNSNLKIINVSGKKKIIINKERKNPDIKIVKRDKI